MKIIIFSDVHGNFNSLQALTKTEDFKTADKRVFLGDVFICCSRPNECIELLKKYNCICLLGNNDSYVCYKIPKDYVKSEKIKQIEYFQSIATEENKKFVLTWKKDFYLNFGSNKIYFTHYPWKNNEDVVDSPFENPTQNYPEIFKNIDANYIFFGHEHIPTKLTQGNKHFYLLGTLGLKSPGYYLMLNVTKDKLNVEEKSVWHDINYEIELMDKAGYPYNKKKVKKQEINTKNGE